MDVALLTASLAILVWMCLQVAYLARESRQALEPEAPTSPAPTGAVPAGPLAIADQALTVD